MLLFVAALAMQGAAPASPKPLFVEPPMAREPAGEIEAVMLSPLFREPFYCGDHAAGAVTMAGDSLGTDCQVLGGVRGENRSFGRLFRTDGLRNEDWYSWGVEVLAPFDGVVAAVYANPRVNAPGAKGRPPAGSIWMRRDDGLVVLYGHLTDFQVAKGDRIRAGQAIGKVGNNGPSWAPHVHAGAYRGDVPYQIRWDQRAMARLQREGAAR